MKLELVATATFGLEAVVRREIEALGYKVLKTEDGRVTYMGDERAVVRSNLWLRTADRVYLRVGEFKAVTFEELFQQVKGIPWENIIPEDGSFPVVGGSVKSSLHSVPACQSIIKKAVVSRLSEFYCRDILPETGAEYRIRFIAHKDVFLILIDTSGAGLHKRGYRVSDVAAPIKETLAAALVQLSFYRKDRVLVDTCCGSGTIPIEAAMIARNIAPGLSRDFVSMKWDMIGEDLWKEEKRYAYEAADFETDLNITGMDIDRRAVGAAKANADEAGVIDDLDLICMDMTKWEPGAGIPKGVSADEYGVVISNLPYGVRIGDREANQKLYKHYAHLIREYPTWSFFLITSDKDIEKEIEKITGRKADRRRKLYNGQIETQFYQYHGKRPPRETQNRIDHAD
ncbi:MAG: class I SAM-dependent RNA methyltransferase [Mogibacterium sp.]|nr:class I SAM-dependent RNA methyltransferase [Mogibacterium sp.]